MSKKMKVLASVLVAALAFVAVSCAGPVGETGAIGPQGPSGVPDLPSINDINALAGFQGFDFVQAADFSKNAGIFVGEYGADGWSNILVGAYGASGSKAIRVQPNANATGRGFQAKKFFSGLVSGKTYQVITKIKIAGTHTGSDTLEVQFRPSETDVVFSRLLDDVTEVGTNNVKALALPTVAATGFSTIGQYVVVPAGATNLKMATWASKNGVTFDIDSVQVTEFTGTILALTAGVGNDSFAGLDNTDFTTNPFGGFTSTLDATGLLVNFAVDAANSGTWGPTLPFNGNRLEGGIYTITFAISGNVGTGTPFLQANGVSSGAIAAAATSVVITAVTVAEGGNISFYLESPAPADNARTFKIDSVTYTKTGEL